MYVYILCEEDDGLSPSGADDLINLWGLGVCVDIFHSYIRARMFNLPFVYAFASFAYTLETSYLFASMV